MKFARAKHHSFSRSQPASVIVSDYRLQSIIFLLRVPTMRRKVLRHRRNQVATMRLIDQGRLRAVKRQTIFTVDSLCIRPFFYRAMLCMRGTRHVSVRLSVRPSHVGVLLKRLNVESHKQHHTIVQRL